MTTVQAQHAEAQGLPEGWELRPYTTQAGKQAFSVWVHGEQDLVRLHDGARGDQSGQEADGRAGLLRPGVQSRS